VIQERLKELGLVLPEPPKPVASYLPSQKDGKQIFTSGQLPTISGNLSFRGRFGENITVEKGKELARIAVLNALSSLLLHIPDLDSVSAIVKLGAYIASSPDFTEQHLVANGASDLLLDIFGEQGRHARFAVGVPSLPLGAPLEIELLVSIK